MFGRKIRLFSMFGFEVSIDASWLIIAVLVTWSLAVGFFPYYYPGLDKVTSWAMGVVGALGLFASIIFHEFCHSIVARHYGLPMKGITLFMLGGVAEMSEEPRNPKTELLMALAGPVASLVLSAVFWVLAGVAEGSGWPLPVQGVIGYLAFINLILALFNMLPAFPLDGGRVLRSILWLIKRDMTWATRMASGIGSVFGLVLVGLGLLNAFTGNVISGLWYVVIGLFLRGAAQSSYRQILLRNTLSGHKVKDLMKEPVTVPPDITLDELVRHYIYKWHFKTYPVVTTGVGGDQLVGCVSTRQVRHVPEEEWPNRTVADISGSCSIENTVSPETDVVQAFQVMNRSGNSRLLVVDHGKLVGIIALKDIAGFLSVHMDLHSGHEV